MEICKSLKKLKSLVLINLGAIIDLSEFWFSEESNKIRCYVFDHNRPIHHNNIFSRKKIVLVDDGYCKLEKCPANEDLERIESDEEFEDLEEEG